MPRCGIREKINTIGRGPRERCRSVPRGAPFLLFFLAPFFRELFDSRSSFFAPNRTETLATQAVADRESSAALCHGVASAGYMLLVALKKKGSVADRESGVALCHGVALKKKKKGERSVADRESSIAQCHGVALKKKKGKKKMIGRGPREMCIAIPRFGINNALQGRKERNSKGVWEGV